MAPRKKRVEPWFYKYLRREIRKIWGWSPARKAAKKRAQVRKNPEAYQCEDCKKHPLFKGEYEVDHVSPMENVNGWDGWGPLIERALGVEVDGLRVLCKPCHLKKSISENAIRRKNKSNVV